MTAKATLCFRILGCGSSGGVPRIGGEGGANWGACDPANPKNRRRRCALLVTRDEEGGAGATRVLIDAGPDIREQLLDAAVPDLDAVCLTHDHADHVHGIDDLRPIVIARRARLPVWTDETTAAVMTRRFEYVFVQPENSSYYPLYDLGVFDQSVTIDGAGGPITVDAHIVEHGPNMTARGFRIGDVAYTPDVSGLPQAAIDALEGLDLWIVDALRYTPHPTHAHLERTLEWIEQLKPKRAILTNLHNDLDYDDLAGQLPPHVTPAYDGLEVVI